MTRMNLPRRAAVAAAVFAAVLALAPVFSAQSGLLSRDVHNFVMGMTDIPIPNNAPEGLLLNSPGTRLVFDHSAPLSYDPNTMVLKVQAFSGRIGRETKGCG